MERCKSCLSPTSLIEALELPWDRNQKFYFCSIKSNNHLFSFLRYLYFCAGFFGYVGKRFDRKAKVNYKICNAINWNTNNYNKHIARYLKK